MQEAELPVTHNVLTTVTVVAILGTAVVYGTDVFCALVLRPAYRHVDDRALAAVSGHVHRYGDRRLPFPGALGVAGATVSCVVAVLTGHIAAAVLAALAVSALVAWLVLYVRVSSPINRQLVAAAIDGRTPSDVRALQDAWDHIITGRALLQGIAVTALCGALFA